jgi:hypothetical protein
MKKIILILSVLFIAIPSFLFAQEPSEHSEHHETHETHHADKHEKLRIHRLVLFTGYGLLPGAINQEGQEELKVIPILGLDYEFWFNHKFGLATQNDLELAQYIVEKDHQEYIDRNYAFVSSLVFLWESLPGWALFTGPGYEFEAHHNFPLWKIGTDISKTFEGGWSTGITLSYDIKEINSSVSVGVTVAKRIGKQ